jgi:hypothetical protein
MIIVFDKYTFISLFLTSTAIISVKQWIYGIFVLILGITVLVQSYIKKKPTKIISYSALAIVVIVSLYILVKSRMDMRRKIYTIILLILSICVGIYSHIYKSKKIFTFWISKYLSMCIFYIMLINVSIIHDNQIILYNIYYYITGPKIKQIKNKKDEIKKIYDDDENDKDDDDDDDDYDDDDYGDDDYDDDDDGDDDDE